MTLSLNERAKNFSGDDKILLWERELFLTGDEKPHPCPPVIDVTGRARFLFYGPYQTVAPGHWSVRVSLQLCQDAARCQLAVQFGAEPDYTTVALPLGQSGLHQIDIEHAFKQGDAAQVRLWLKRAAFHGELRLLGAVARRLSAATAPNAE